MTAATPEGPGATLEQVLEALEAVERNPAPPLEIISLRCNSRFVGDMINGRYLRTPCNGSFCKVPGQRHTDHVFDTFTGRHRTINDEHRTKHPRRPRNAPA